MTKLEKILKEELQEAQYIGEDGGMVVDGSYTPEEAYGKMLERYRDDCGQADMEDLREHWFKSPDDLSIGWLHLVTKENRYKFDEGIEWYVSYVEKSPYEVWVYFA